MVPEDIPSVCPQLFICVTAVKIGMAKGSLIERHTLLTMKVRSKGVTAETDKEMKNIMSQISKLDLVMCCCISEP